MTTAILHNTRPKIDPLFRLELDLAQLPIVQPTRGELLAALAAVRRVETAEWTSLGDGVGTKSLGADSSPLAEFLWAALDPHSVEEDPEWAEIVRMAMESPHPPSEPPRNRGKAKRFKACDRRLTRSELTRLEPRLNSARAVDPELLKLWEGVRTPPSRTESPLERERTAQTMVLLGDRLEDMGFTNPEINAGFRMYWGDADDPPIDESGSANDEMSLEGPHQRGDPVPLKLDSRLLPNTDTGNAERLVKRHGGTFRYCHPQKTWYVWDKSRWQADRSGQMMDLIKSTVRELYNETFLTEEAPGRKQSAAWAIKSESTDRKKAALISAQSEPGVPVLPEEFDRCPELLNCRNGTIDLRTGHLLPHDREHLITKLSPVEYDADARSPLWERFLGEATGGDQEFQAFLQRAVGYSLTGLTTEEVLFFVHGPAASGKSTFLEAVKSVLGDFGRGADFETFIQRRDAGGVRNDIAELAGCRFVVSIEVDEGKRLAEGLVKLLTGGDTVRARFLYQEAFQFTPQFKLWLAANHAPIVKHDDSAMWRRILRIPFERVVPKERRDPALKAKLRNVEECGPAILTWAVEGSLRWREEGLQVPEQIHEATERYRGEMDPLREFLSECCVLLSTIWTPAAMIRRAYEDFCRVTGETHILGPREFADGLKARGCTRDKRHAGHGWLGIGLATDSDTTP